MSTENAVPGPGHLPVLLKEVVGLLDPPPDGSVLDATVGLGGHSVELLKRLPRGQLVGLDQDADALQRSAQSLGKDPRVTLLKANFAGILETAGNLSAAPFDGVLMDLGVSSLQLGLASRGFSFLHPGPLDMRMDPSQAASAYDVVNTYDEKALAEILFRLGEEPKARQLARLIVDARRNKPLATTSELAALAERVYPARHGPERSRRHPATKLFQAVRMEVNRELEVLERGLKGALQVLKPGGKLAVISFHSLEDRMVKEFLKRESTDCLCPPKIPACVCGHRASLKLLTRKPVTASEDEMRENPRSRSAKLRGAVKI